LITNYKLLLKFLNISFYFRFSLQARSQNFEKWLLALSCLFVRQSVRMEQLGYHQTDLHEIWFWSISRKSVEEIKVSLKSGKHNDYFTWRPINIFDHFSLSSCNECQVCVIFKFLKVATAPQSALHNPVATVTSLPQTQHVARVCSNDKVPYFCNATLFRVIF